MHGQHTHWEKYHIRIVKVWQKDYLQLICLDDGIIFHEVEIQYESKANS